ncbi:hypothetical protein QBC33DRAFT_539641 [Phialemonium atrogriseum]|uniref:Cytidyltransferase-like domain-containing protein n=1 Tax=Phialemonium atrogriseum TaxID=1093897 RepID=A0AAJ0C188_9PEZI|nr:uncharacterized protein QBC33DRAFT_539641 [Phialemonium atrogriseum]KAK1767238.1 hypothetical protein QBC33DRAFT_539641 [Phialemonium atrogriseum]
MKRDDLPSLLLLPFPPNPASRQSLSAAYRPPLTAALSKLKRPDKASKLIIAVACPILHGQFFRDKTFSWAELQSLVAGIYSIVSVICAQQSIAADVEAGPGSVDATVVLVDHDREKRFMPDFRPAIEPNNTAIVDLATFSSAYYPWNFIFHVRCEAGLKLHQTYLQLSEGRQTLLQEQLVPVEGGLSMNVTGDQPKVLPAQTQTRSVVCLGGTFDHLHPGHKLLLTAGAFLLKVPDEGSSETSKFIIGVTGDEMLKNKKFAEYVEPWDTRARNILRFLSTLLGLSSRGWKDIAHAQIREEDGQFSASFRDGLITVHCVEIQDAFGPTITTEDMDILVVSGETRSGGRAVNDRRVERGWHPLEVYEVDVLDAEEISDEPSRGEQSFASKISSTAIRQQRAEGKKTGAGA